MIRTLTGCLVCVLFGSIATANDWSPSRLGYTSYRTNLSGGRQPNIATMRAWTVNADGSDAREVAPRLSDEANSWTQFAGWSPEGSLAIVGRGWESPENAKWEEEHRTFRFIEGGWLYDMYLFDAKTNAATNMTSVDRVSFYNTGLFFWPDDPKSLGFQALIDGNSHPFRMDRDGKNKRDLTAESKEFSYGFSASPDGRRIAYHKSYQVFIADRDGSNAKKVETGHPFNFAPQWSPDSSHLLFVSGEHENCHPHLVRADGSGLRKIADRGGYVGWMAFLDVPDFHNGSSDIPAWAPDGTWVYYTSKIGDNIELFRVDRSGKNERLTTTPKGSSHYHPTPSPDGKFLAYGSKRDGLRRLYVMRLSDLAERPITPAKAGHGSIWPQWRPAGR